VNLFYPEWTGGWSTGPRLLVPLIPFAMLPVAALLAGDSRWANVAALVALMLALAGALVILLFQGVGARIPQGYNQNPLVQVVWPLWSGRVPLPPGFEERFTRNLTSVAAPEWVSRLSPGWQAVQFVPLLICQAIALLGLWRHLRGRGESPNSFPSVAVPETKPAS
jgi:hypothetical protein